MRILTGLWLMAGLMVSAWAGDCTARQFKILKAYYFPADSKETYELENYLIDPSSGGSFRLALLFENGRKLTYRFQIRKDRIIFFTPEGEREVRLPARKWRFKRVPGSHRIVRISPNLSLDLPAAGGRVSLVLKAAR